MWTAILTFLTDSTVLTLLGSILLLVSGAIGGQHPSVAGLLAAIGAWLKNRVSGGPPATLLALVALLLLTEVATAGPILRVLRARRAGGSCSTCQPAPQYAPTAGVPKSCFNCEKCANACSCFGSGYYCSDAKCPVGFGPPVGYPVGVPPYQTPRFAPQLGAPVPSCPNGRCPTPSRSR